jgi:hypothetical protein
LVLPVIAFSHHPVDLIVAGIVLLGCAWLVVLGLVRAASRADEPTPGSMGYSHFVNAGSTVVAEQELLWFAVVDRDIDIPLPPRSNPVIVRPIE